MIMILLEKLVMDLERFRMTVIYKMDYSLYRRCRK